MTAIISTLEKIKENRSKAKKSMKNETNVEIENGRRKESKDISSNKGGNASKINGNNHCIWKSIEILFILN
jgi:hypothetical protein